MDKFTDRFTEGYELFLTPQEFLDEQKYCVASLALAAQKKHVADLEKALSVEKAVLARKRVHFASCSYKHGLVMKRVWKRRAQEDRAVRADANLAIEDGSENDVTDVD